MEGTDKKGTKVKGELSSQNPTLVKAQLRKQGITPVKVRKKGISLLGAGRRSSLWTSPCSPARCPP